MRKLLIANRGEIACRIARTCRRMGLPAATVHSSADRDALHVRDVGESIEIGGASPAESYLNAQAIVRAALKVGADAIHPGIGFLSEDPNFAELVELGGLTFIGPKPDTMRRFGDKWAAKREARSADVPVIGGSEGSLNDAVSVERLIRDGMRLPVVLKAAAGGGGRGVRIVRDLTDLRGVIESAMREALSSFGRSDLIVEEFIENARHLEVQVAGNGKGDAIHLYERECSLQRRFQKIIEEAPSVNVPEDLRKRILEDAVRLARSVHYRGVGTMEFLVAEGRHYFLECNPRLQVEHTVTEEILGVDLVELQLKIAEVGVLPFAQSQVVVRGHAIQARVYAEDTAAGFLPSTGRIDRIIFPTNIRVETGVESGSSVTPHYDSMIAKIVAVADDRQRTLDRLDAALQGTFVSGVETNLTFLSTLLRHPIVRQGIADNRFIDREIANLLAAAQTTEEDAAVAAAIVLKRWNQSGNFVNQGLWSGEAEFLGWRLEAKGSAPSDVPAFSLADAGGREWKVALRSSADGISVVIDKATVNLVLHELQNDRVQVRVGDRAFVAAFHWDGLSIRLQLGGATRSFVVRPFLSLDALTQARGGQLRAPMMGVIRSVKAKVGDVVVKGQVLVVEESMKMELSVEAPCAGVVSAIHCAEGSMVERHQVLAEVEVSHD